MKVRSLYQKEDYCDSLIRALEDLAEGNLKEIILVSTPPGPVKIILDHPSGASYGTRHTPKASGADSSIPVV